MVRIRHFLSILSLLVVVLVGCKNSGVDTTEPSGSIRLGVIGIDSAATTRALVDELQVRIENTRAEVLRQWASVGDVPSQIRVTTGSYKIVAWKGDTALIPSFDDMYYEGSVKFSVAANEVVDTSLTVKMGVTKVRIVFDEQSFADNYTAFSADVRTTSATNANSRALNYTTADTQEGNFMPGTLRLRLRLTSKKDNLEYVFMPQPIEGLQAAEIRTVNLKVVKTSAGNTLNVTMDNGYAKDTTINLTLPSSVLPKLKPVVRASNFEVNGIVEGNEAFIPTAKYAATIVAQAGIKSVKIRTSSPSVKEMWGGRAEIELVGASIEIRNLLEATGFNWGNALSTAALAEKCYGRTEINFTKLFGGLRATPNEAYTDFPFEIEVVDMFNQSNKNASGDGRFGFTTRVKPPIFGWSAPTNGNVWSNRAEFSIHFTCNIAREPKIWMREGEGQWRLPEEQTFIPSGEGVGIQRVNSLKPNTRYTFRLAMNNHTTEEFAATTETPGSVQNGDMETWQEQMLGTSWDDIPYYEPYASGGAKYWATNNLRTTAYRTTTIFGTTYSYNCFPAVSYTFQANSGALAAEIRTTSASDIHPLNFGTVTQSHSQVSGLLYIGTFAYTKPDDVIAYGRPFASRPDKMSFHYTYRSYNSDSFDAQILLYSGADVIGTGKFVSPVGQSISSYTLVDVPVIYSNRTRRADKMAIVFRSTTKATPEVNNPGISLDYRNAATALSFSQAWYGSVLRVDDVSISY